MTPKWIEGGPVWTLDEVAAALRCNERTIRDLIKNGVVPAPMRAGVGPTSPFRFTITDLENLEAALRPPPVEAKRRRRRKAA